MFTGNRRGPGGAYVLCIGMSVAALGACGDDASDTSDVVDGAFEALAGVGPTYEVALSDSNTFRTCVTSSIGDPSTLQDCADNSSDAISGPDTVATLVADRGEPLREVADDDRAAACLGQIGILDQELDAWFTAGKAWRAAYDADPAGASLTGDLIDAVGDRQAEAEAAWNTMRTACRAGTEG